MLQYVEDFLFATLDRFQVDFKQKEPEVFCWLGLSLCGEGGLSHIWFAVVSVSTFTIMG